MAADVGPDGIRALAKRWRAVEKAWAAYQRELKKQARKARIKTR